MTLPPFSILSQRESYELGETADTSTAPKAIGCTSIMVIAQEYLAGKTCSQSMRSSLKTLFRLMCRFEYYTNQSTGGHFVWDTRTVCAKDIQAFIRYAENEGHILGACPSFFKGLQYPEWLAVSPRGRRPTCHSQNSLALFTILCKTFFKWIGSTCHLEHFHPFEGLQTPTCKYGEPICLTREERDFIANFDLGSHKLLEIVRDCFVFQCLVGCRYSDLFELTRSNVCNDTLLYIPIKTRSYTQAKAEVHLTRRAKEIIGKYTSGKDDGQRLFPFMSLSVYNKRIHALFELIHDKTGKLGRPVGEAMRPLYEAASSHLARRTFINIIYQIDPNPAIISQMSGHASNSSAFHRYHTNNTAYAARLVEQSCVSDTKGAINRPLVDELIEKARMLTKEERCMLIQSFIR